MNYFRFFRSSIGKKIIMATTGIFLIVFLFLHLVINCSLFFGEKSFNNSVYFMRNNTFIHIMEYVLSTGFIIHILIGVNLSFQNYKKSKGKFSYLIKSLHITTDFSSRTMIYTGILILCFLILHLINFSIPMKYSYNNYSDYYLVISLFKNPLYTIIYVISFLILGIHLNHGFQSSFQSLGLSRNRFFFIKQLGLLYSCIISSGFSIIAIWFFLN